MCDISGTRSSTFYLTKPKRKSLVVCCNNPNSQHIRIYCIIIDGQTIMRTLTLLNYNKEY